MWKYISSYVAAMREVRMHSSVYDVINKLQLWLHYKLKGFWSVKRRKEYIDSAGKDLKKSYGKFLLENTKRGKALKI